MANKLAAAIISARTFCSFHQAPIVILVRLTLYRWRTRIFDLHPMRRAAHAIYWPSRFDTIDRVALVDALTAPIGIEIAALFERRPGGTTNPGILLCRRPRLVLEINIRQRCPPWSRTSNFCPNCGMGNACSCATQKNKDCAPPDCNTVAFFKSMTSEKKLRRYAEL